MKKKAAIITVTFLLIILGFGIYIETESNLSSVVKNRLNEDYCQETIIDPIKKWESLSNKEKREAVKNLWALVFSPAVGQFTITTELPSSEKYTIKKGYIEFSDEYIQSASSPVEVIHTLAFASRELEMTQQGLIGKKMVSEMYAKKFSEHISHMANLPSDEY